MNSVRHRGFTLYELLVTLLVAGVIFGLGIPNLLEFRRNSTMTAMVNDMTTSIRMARTAALERRVPVTLCSSPNPVDASPTCSADGSGTRGGYVVWVDEDADAIVDAGEQILQQHEDPVAITVFRDNGYLNFGISGYLNDISGLGLAASTILFCDTRGNTVAAGSLSAARVIRIRPTGHGTVLQEINQIAPIVANLGADCS